MVYEGGRVEGYVAKLKTQARKCDFDVNEVDNLGKENGQYLIDQVCAHLDLVEKEYFCLSFEDCNKTKEELTRYQVYLQLRRDLRAGRLSPPEEEAALLAALVLQVETGDHDPEEQRGRYASDYSLVWRASSRLEERTMELHSRQTRGLDPGQAEMTLLKRAAQLDTYGLRPQAFKDQRGAPVMLGLNFRGISVLQDGRRTHLFRWHDVQKLNFENKMFIVHLVFVEDSRNKTKRTVGYKSDSVQRCRHFWRDATEHRLFFTCESSRSAPRMVLGGSLFSRHSRVRFSGRTEREVCRQPVRREQPQFSRYGLRPSVRPKSQSVPATPCESQGSSSAYGAARLPHDSPIPEHTSLADDETMMVAPCGPEETGGRLLRPLDEIVSYTPPSSPDMSPIRAYESAGLTSQQQQDRSAERPLPLTTLTVPTDSPLHGQAGVSRLERGVPPEPPRRPSRRPSAPAAGRRLLVAPLLRVLLYAVLTVAALLLLLLVAVFELDTAATRELRLFPELQLLRRRLYQPARELVVRGVSL
ncbi:FERM domain-containing protein 5 [Amphibalanus amphitrite]|uniref:FERM domain-containing protein 5 n=1 Tax=Amphibalanus amphitrite TaxID=1232801 RepID=A0A6A4WQA3_AMPAM|nr:FERM domain-containing protein 5 [Amphibalanus amphitrite]